MWTLGNFLCVFHSLKWSWLSIDSENCRKLGQGARLFQRFFHMVAIDMLFNKRKKEKKQKLIYNPLAWYIVMGISLLSENRLISKEYLNYIWVLNAFLTLMIFSMKLKCWWCWWKSRSLREILNYCMRYLVEHHEVIFYIT